MAERHSPWISGQLDSWIPLTVNKIPVLYRKNSLLFQQGELPTNVYIVKTGRICITCYQENGEEKNIYIIEQGGIIGECSTNGHPLDFTGVAIVDSLIYCIPYSEFYEAMQSSWDFSQLVYQSICRKNMILLDQVISLSFAQTLQRVAQVLLYLGAQYGTDTPEGVLIALKFSHKDIANMINASRVTVNNIFTFFSENGAITRKSGNKMLIDTKMLYGMAYQFPDSL